MKTQALCNGPGAPEFTRKMLSNRFGKPGEGIGLALLEIFLFLVFSGGFEISGGPWERIPLLDGKEVENLFGPRVARLLPCYLTTC
jgi:hypothetical protein